MAVPAENITLRAVAPADWPLIRAWIAEPGVQRWFGSPTAAEAEIRMVIETEGAIARLVLADGAPVGYAHAIDASYWGGDLPEGMEPGTWDADVFIAERAWRGRGVGEKALDLLAEEVFSTTLAVAISVFVSVKNEPAIRAYERAGFVWSRVWEDPIFGASWLMLRERPRR